MESGAEPAGNSRRRGSLSRMLRKLKSVIRRRKGGRNQGAVAESERGAQEVIASDNSTTHVPANGNPQELTNNGVGNAHTSTAPAPISSDIALEADDDTPMTGADNSAIPQIPTSRGVILPARTQALLDSYGVTYEPHNAPTMSCDRPRRVERPIRIRVHWTCHDCNTQFGASKTCVGCGHRRCTDCTRAPTKKVREAMEDSPQMRDDGSPGAGGGGGGNTGGITAALVLETSSLPPAVRAAQPESDKTQSPADTASDNLPPEAHLYLMHQRPSSGIEAFLERQKQPLKAQRTCHECETYFDSAKPGECQQCGHKKCNLCPRETIRSPQGKPSAHEIVEKEPKTVAMVPRVYRKPRQRVRWNCHECKAAFGSEIKCQSCEHERCQECPRMPSKKVVNQPDPALLQSVADKLAHLTVRTTPPATE